MKTIFKKIIISILEIEAKLVLKKYKPKIIAITGSIGKTSTKDALFSIFSSFTYVRKSEKSYNSQIGLLLTILGIPNGWSNPLLWFKNILKGLSLILYTHKYPKWLILEVGVGKPKDMEKTSLWLKTDIVIITAIGEIPAHIEFFNSRKHLIEEKSGLIKTLKNGGLLILNKDDEGSLQMRDFNKKYKKDTNQIITYGFNTEFLKNKTDIDLSGSNQNILYSDKGEIKGIIFRINENENSLPVVMEGVFGKNHIYSALASLALVFALKLNMLEAINILKNYDAPAGRMKLLFGINNSLIIDDTYNSSPFACESALNTLKEIEIKGRKIAVLGDMLELGKYTEEAHRNIGKIVKENAHILITIGQRAEGIKIGAIEAGFKKENIFEFLNVDEAGEFLKTLVQENDLILIKGSQGMRMEKITGSILWDKEKNRYADEKLKKKLLVRQDREWLSKK